MRDIVEYEWCIESVDYHDDIQGSYHGANLEYVNKRHVFLEICGYDCKSRLVLIRDSVNQDGDLNSVDIKHNNKDLKLIELLRLNKTKSKQASALKIPAFLQTQAG